MSKSKVLGIKSSFGYTNEVELQDLEDGNLDQVWKKEKAKTEGYFIFQNLNWRPKVLTSYPVVSFNDIKIEGKNITKGPSIYVLRQHNLGLLLTLPFISA